MTLHLFANIVTDFGTAANNRGENEGNTTTLQKLIWHGQIHTTVSAEAIRFAARQQLATFENGETNRRWNEEARTHEWKDASFTGFADGTGKAKTYIDDDLLGYMRADAAKEENTAGSASVRRAVLEVTRAVSLTPWAGDTTFNAASPGATPSAQKKGSNPVPYGAEIHATRYQFGIAMTPDRLRVKDRAVSALRAITSLRTVAGNHGRFLFDFAPAAIVIRITEDPAPRLLYCFDTIDSGKTVDAPELLRRVLSGDITATELIIGGSLADTETGKRLEDAGAEVYPGIKAATEAAAKRIAGVLA
jgi:CRISPR-associated protein Cst2